MDIFRALSLGTTVRKGGKSAPSGTLPSAGSKANAQLYHDEVGATRGTKRKRTDQGGDDESDEDDAGSLDFFAPKEPTKGAKKVSAQPKTTQKRKPSTKAKLLDEDECRQILRSHRLKFTLLSAGAEKKSKVKKSKKKAKASAKEVKPEKKQLFPQPLQTFGELRSTYNISSRLADNIDAQGYREPTEVQLAGLPLLLDPARALGKALGEDVPAESVDFMGVAPTGSGKTVSFLIPAINSIMKRRAASEERKAHNLEAIIVAPTRELANQIHNEGLKLTAGTGVKIAIMRKGMRIVAEDGEAETEEKESGDESSENSEDEDEDEDSESDEDDSKKPITKADILMTTPMLLLNFLNRGKSKRTIPSVKSLILDEADVLLDELFRDQTIGIWQACTNPELHLTFWSATMGSNIETLATEQLKSHYKQRGTAPKPLIRLVVGLKDTAVPNVTHKLTYTATEPGKLYALRQLLHPVSGSEEGPSLRPPFIVFTQTIERATALHDELKYDIPIEAGGSARIAVLHSSLSDSVRSNIMRRFRLGEIWVLITTDVLARGVDFAGVNGVVNYDVPTSAASYVHRAGRTGRAGREGGVAVTLYTKDDMPYIKTFANVIAMSEKQAGKEESRVLRALLDALPDVKKEDKKKLKTRGVETRRTGTAMITSKSAWERKKEHNRREAIKESRKRKSS